MSLTVRWTSGPMIGTPLNFGDETTEIRFGRNAETCQVVFPPDVTAVGREHCLLQFVSGRYDLRIPRGHLVRINGVEVHDGAPVTEECDLQLGPDGPTVIVAPHVSGSLLPTAPQGRRQGPETLSHAASRSAGRGLAVATTAIILLTAATVTGMRIAKRMHHDVEVVGGDVQDTRQAVATLSSTDSARALQLESLAGLRDDVTGLREDVKRIPPDWEPVLNQAAQSVYLVLTQSSDRVSPMATAWVVDRERGWLATNGHVAEEFANLADGEALIVRSPGENPVDVTIESVEIHPGYDAFQKQWSSFDPVEQLSFEFLKPIMSAGPACDVALLKAASGSTLAAALPLASDEVLRALKPGDTVATIGFPMEGLVLNGVNAQRPAPKMRTGSIVAMTDFFGAAAPPEDRLLVQHGLPTVGGASGSPIINSLGQVIAVHNAGNSLAVIKGFDGARVRLSSGAAIGFGQRADLLRELLDGVAEERLAPRLTQWQDSFTKYYKSRSEVLETISQAARNEWLQGVSAIDLIDFDSSEVASEVVSPSDYDSDLKQVSADWEFTGAADGHYLLVAQGNDQSLDLLATVTDAESAETIAEGDEDRNSWHEFLPFESRLDQRLTIHFIAKPKDSQTSLDDLDLRINVTVYRADLPSLDHDDLIAKRVTQWRDELIADGEDVGDAQLVSIEQRSLISHHDLYLDKIDVELEGSGRFLLVALTSDLRDCNLAAYEENSDDPIAYDRRISPEAHVSLGEQSDSRELILYVTGAAESDYEFRIYKVESP